MLSTTATMALLLLSSVNMASASTRGMPARKKEAVCREKFIRSSALTALPMLNSFLYHGVFFGPEPLRDAGGSISAKGIAERGAVAVRVGRSDSVITYLQRCTRCEAPRRLWSYREPPVAWLLHEANACRSSWRARASQRE